jgi:hypothetical protein
MADTSAAASPERSAMACDDLGCTIAVRDSLEIDNGPVRLVRLWTDGTHGPPVDVAGAYAVAGFACTAGICLLTQQRDGLAGPVEGMLLDAAGTPIGPVFPIMTADDSNYGFDIGADATGFTVTVDHGATSSVQGQTRVVHVGLDGSVGPASDTVPSGFYGAFEHSTVACSPTRCMVASSLQWVLYRARVDAGIPVDVAPLYLPAGNGQASVSIATDGGGYLVSWTDYRLDAEQPTRERRAAIWSGTDWGSPTSVPLPSSGVAGGWEGIGYLIAARSGDMLSLVRLAPDGTSIDPTPIQTPVPMLVGVAAVACQPMACLIVYRTTQADGLARLDASGNLVLLPATSPVAKRLSISRFGDDFAVAAQDSADRMWLLPFTSEGEQVGAVDFTDSVPTASAVPQIAEVGDHLVAGWFHLGDFYVVRRIASDLVLGPVIEFPITAASSVRLDALAGDALLTWSGAWPSTTLYAARLGPDLELLDPTPIAIADIASVGFTGHALASTGSTALCGWSSLDDAPSLMTERLAIRSIVIQ